MLLNARISFLDYNIWPCNSHLNITETQIPVFGSAVNFCFKLLFESLMSCVGTCD